MVIMKKIHEELKEYIRYERRMSETRCALEMGITKQYLNTITNGKIIPGKKVALKIQEWTNGKYKASDLMGL